MSHRCSVQRAGSRFSQGDSIRLQHGRDESAHEPALPDGVLLAGSTQEVADVAALCHRHRVPMIAYGTGSSVEGQVLAIHGGLTISLAGMDQVLAVHAEDLDAVVQPGVTRNTLNAALYPRHGLFFPIDPGADASLGGMAATRASGTNAVRYGTMRDNVLALTVVLADGASSAPAAARANPPPGYDLTRLFVGSEGTLGIITEVTLRLHGIPEAMSAAVCAFESLRRREHRDPTIQIGIPVARIELLDALQIDGREPPMPKLGCPKAARRSSSSSTAPRRGGRTGRDRRGDRAGAIGGRDFRWATPKKTAQACGRRAMTPLCQQGKCAGLAMLADRRLRADFASGRLHPAKPRPTSRVAVPDRPRRPCRRRQLSTSASWSTRPTRRDAREAEGSTTARRARLAMSGTCTGEHGIGSARRIFLTGTQALVRLLMLQRERDAAARPQHRPASSRAIAARRSAARPGSSGRPGNTSTQRIVFQPGVNEDLAATAVWGTQQAICSPGAQGRRRLRHLVRQGPGRRPHRRRLQARQPGRHLAARRRAA
jgi:D-lactate dehydrogenase (cytochrome)